MLPPRTIRLQAARRSAPWPEVTMDSSSATGGGLLRASGLCQQGEYREHQRNCQPSRYAVLKPLPFVDIGQRALQ